MFVQKFKASHRNLVLVTLLILILIIAISVTYYFQSQKTNRTNDSTKSDFKLSLSSSNGTATQGESAKIHIDITYISGKSLDVTLSASINQSVTLLSFGSSIQYSFEPSVGAPNFNSTLTLNVPASTPTNYYSVNVTATNGEVTHNASYTIAVLSSKVSLSGAIFQGYSGGPVVETPTKMKFVDISTGASFTANLNALANANQNMIGTYSIYLDNGHTYNVSLTVDAALGSSVPRYQPHETDTFNLGLMTASSSVAQSTQTQNFTDHPISGTALGQSL
jgi:hypothetical protein